MSKKAKNVVIMLLLLFSFGIVEIITALPPQLQKCVDSENQTCGDSYGPGNQYMGKKCWPETGSHCYASS